MTIPATSAVCSVFTFLIAGSPIFYSASPRGFCSSCCQIKERDDIKFMLYTRQNPSKAQNLYLSDEKRLRKSNFNLNYPLVIYLHGFSESATGDRQSSQELKDAFLKAGNYNVILVDWSPLTAVPWYANAVENLPVSARYVARFIRFLIQRGYPTTRIHLVGFSLGAEVTGFIGKQLQEWGIKLPRITALDPALPLFEDGSANRRLGPADAQFVDVIHTDGGILGNPEAMGHVDFYPNGGHALQPGCARQEIANNRWLGILIGCSHQRAWEYFIESVRYPLAFPANRCEPSKLFGTCRDGGNGKAFMGMGADRRLRGKFFLDTNGEPPYGRNTLRVIASALGGNPRKSSAALTFVPFEQYQQEQQVQQYEQQTLPTNIATLNVQRNDTTQFADVRAGATLDNKSNNFNAATVIRNNKSNNTTLTSQFVTVANETLAAATGSKLPVGDPNGRFGAGVNQVGVTQTDGSKTNEAT